MLIQLTCERSGRTGYHLEGDVIDVPVDEAMRMLRAGQAVSAEPETATPVRPPNAAKRPIRK